MLVFITSMPGLPFLDVLQSGHVSATVAVGALYGVVFLHLLGLWPTATVIIDGTGSDLRRSLEAHPDTQLERSTLHISSIPAAAIAVATGHRSLSFQVSRTHVSALQTFLADLYKRPADFDPVLQRAKAWAFVLSGVVTGAGALAFLLVGVDAPTEPVFGESTVALRSIFAMTLTLGVCVLAIGLRAALLRRPSVVDTPRVLTALALVWGAGLVPVAVSPEPAWTALTALLVSGILLFLAVRRPVTARVIGLSREAFERALRAHLDNEHPGWTAGPETAGVPGVPQPLTIRANTISTFPHRRNPVAISLVRSFRQRVETQRYEARGFKPLAIGLLFIAIGIEGLWFWP